MKKVLFYDTEYYEDTKSKPNINIYTSTPTNINDDYITSSVCYKSCVYNNLVTYICDGKPVVKDYTRLKYFKEISVGKFKVIISTT